MEFFDSIINQTEEIIKNQNKTVHNYDSAQLWTDVGYNQVILQKETALELDGTGFSLVTANQINDEIIIVGKDLNELCNKTQFARIAIVEIDEIDDAQELHDSIKKAEYVKYNCYPDGFMIRSASSSYKESVRVSVNALKDGISFEKIGNLLISKYKELPYVKHVKMIFITSESIDCAVFRCLADKCREITQTLNQVMNNLMVDCDSCNLKAICDEVEGMRELHFKAVKKTGDKDE